MARARDVPGFDCEESFSATAARVVEVRAGEVFAYSDGVLDTGEIERVHDMRIAAKRLRYVLEITGPCFGPEAKAARDAARRLQSVLGEIHDCDVMLPRVWGIESLRNLLRTRRELLLRQFSELWQAELDKGTWAALDRFTG